MQDFHPYSAVTLPHKLRNMKISVKTCSKTYNNVRILAADKSLPFGTIIKVSNLKDYNDFIGIVLDRGSAISFDGFSQIDLLFESEDYSYNFGRKENVIFEILRLGY